MHLSPKEINKLIISQAGWLAQKRLARGVKLNQTEAIALIASQLHERIRDGSTVSRLMNEGKKLLGKRHVQANVVHGLKEIQVEGTFEDGTYLVTVHNPICTDDGDLENAFYGSFLPIPPNDIFPLEPTDCYEPSSQPGAVRVVKGVIPLNEGRNRIKLKVMNKGDRPVQVGSHYHFIETNSSLEFDRIASYGRRLDIPAGTAVRFEPGDIKTVSLVEIGGNRIITGGNNLSSGPVSAGQIDDILVKIKQAGFLHMPSPDSDLVSYNPPIMGRDAYAQMFGPTTGDLVRLGDTELWVRVEKDFTVYGDECKFGGGKVIRDGMGQASGRTDRECLDLVITNALIVDYTGIYKEFHLTVVTANQKQADIGITNGVIVGIGKSGNPDIMDGVTPGMVIGSNTDVIAGEKKIITAGGIDSHIHLICPQQVEESITSGITTYIGGGTGPSTGTNATTCTPSAYYIRSMLQSLDTLPINIGITGKGNDTGPMGLRDQVVAGVIGLKLHEDWGSTPSAIDTCLEVCDEFDIQCLIHTDTLNESGFVQSTVDAFKGRTIHMYHTEGAGGGHAPDIISVVEHPNTLPSSTNPTRPFTCNTLDEHLDMLMVCHHLSKSIPEDIAFAESRIRAETIAAEDVLHDTGAISMMSSDSQAMGRCGEVILRTWKTAHKNKIQRGSLAEEVGEGDNFRVKRYISKYTINPAIAHGMSHLIGSIEVGKLADIVLWKVVSLHTPRWEGDANASIPTVQPIYMKPMFGAFLPVASIAFMSQVAVDNGLGKVYGLKKRVEPVKHCRKIGKSAMKYNDATPKMRVDPELYQVYADGILCEAEPCDKLPLTNGYFLY